MEELHHQEQYFYTKETVMDLADVVQKFKSPCCLCTPMLGKELARRGVSVRILDIDQRFSMIKGFRFYNLYRPDYLEEEFDVIICDPPFFRVSLSQLFHCIRMLSHYELKQPLLMSYLTRRSEQLLGTFAPFGLVATGYFPSYVTVQREEYNQIEFYTNLSDIFKNHQKDSMRDVPVIS